MGNFLNIFQEFSTNNFQYKKQLSVQKNTAKEFISQDYESGKYVFGEGVISSSLQVLQNRLCWCVCTSIVVETVF